MFSSELADMGVRKGKKAGDRQVQRTGEVPKDVSKLVSQSGSWN